MDEKTREKIALKRFSIISPILNEQVESQQKYCEDVCSKPIEMPHYGLREYNPKTIMSWLWAYKRGGGLDALKPCPRSDRGRSRKVSDEVIEKARQLWEINPRYTTANVYEQLLKDRVTSPEKLSPATFYRFVALRQDLLTEKDGVLSQKKESKRFSHQFINELWQTDLMYGPYLKVGRAKKQTYLSAIIDDASRLICHAEFFFSQDFNILRKTFKEAVLRRGIPKLLYTDNGKIYRSGQFASVCANLGTSLVHTQPFSPSSKGKVERYFLTVRQRFLNRLDINEIKSLDELNFKFRQWLEEDYQRKKHSALDMSPLDFFMSQAHLVKMLPDPALLDEYFLLRIQRKVKHDATISLDKVLYETDMKLAGLNLEVRYEPEWLNQPAKPILLFDQGKKVGTARQVNFHDNAHAKRGGTGNTHLKTLEKQEENKHHSEKHNNGEDNQATPPRATISFSSIMKKEVEDE